MSQRQSVSRRVAILMNRLTISIVVPLALGSYFWRPSGILSIVADILVRTYLHFVAGAMAHEAAHGNVGSTRRSNLWWGRISLIPTTVPNITFRKTHLHHHASTNIPGKDPDEFLNTAHRWEVPFRALAMPHHWVVWLYKQGSFGRRERIEYVLHYLAIIAVFSLIAAFTGAQRVLLGLLPAAILHSMLLWIFFAIKTHEGYSTGIAETRSHNYYGKPLCFLSFGLSMHRLHHLKPGLAWLQMIDQVSPGTWKQRLFLARDVRKPLAAAA